MTFGRVLLLLAALPASRPLAAQDSVRLRLQPAPGTTVAYRVTMETWMSGPGVPEDTAPSMRARSRLTVGLIGPGGDNGALDFQTRTDSMEIASAMPGVTSSLPPVVPRTDTVRVSRLGIVMPSPWSSRRDSMMAALGGAGAFGKGGSGEITFFIFPDHALRVGSTWADTTTTNDSTGAGSMHGTIHTVNRLDRITRDGAQVVAVFSQATNLEATMDLGQFQMAGTSVIEIDAATGLVIRVTESSTGFIDVGGMSLPMRMRLAMERVP